MVVFFFVLHCVNPELCCGKVIEQICSKYQPSIKKELSSNAGNSIPFECGKVIATVLQEAELFRLKMNNPYIHYYFDQQQGREMPMFTGSSWQRGHEQMGYGFGALLGGLSRAAKSSWKKLLERLPSLAGLTY